MISTPTLSPSSSSTGLYPIYTSSTSLNSVATEAPNVGLNYNEMPVSSTAQAVYSHLQTISESTSAIYKLWDRLNPGSKPTSDCLGITSRERFSAENPRWAKALKSISATTISLSFFLSQCDWVEPHQVDTEHHLSPLACLAIEWITQAHARDYPLCPLEPSKSPFSSIWIYAYV